MYDHTNIEEKWLRLWESEQLFQQTERPTAEQDPMFLLFAFAYPSGSGLHVGHVESKTALDILARYYRMSGRAVFFPVGWDAFGLPAENYAIKTGIHPAETTRAAIDTFRRQIKRLGISYDWANELATNHPGYYRWTQWLFAQLFQAGLAYQGTGMVNWCPSCQTVLANEQVVDGSCERCGTDVLQKEMKQWFFKITEYRDELISGLDEVDWPAATKQQQLNWIGKSEGANIRFRVAGSKPEDYLEVYTTAHDTIYGCTFMVVAPEHAFVQSHKERIKNWKEVTAYITSATKKTERSRQTQKEKTGVQVEGITLINPANGKEVPIYVADYVLVGYGTGAIMAVPGHDQRDREFAEKYGIEVISTAKPFRGDAMHFIDYSEIKQNHSAFKMINSAEFDGMSYLKARQKILAKIKKSGAAESKVQYKLRDWLISRQRYWGAPIPVIYDPDEEAHLVPDEKLPWELPTDVDFKPTGESPLVSSTEFQKRTELVAATHFADLIKQNGWDSTGKGWRPEYDTMDTFVDSSWYYLRYTDARNTDVFADSDQLKRWLPVDFYMIGPEHIVLHLLYSRFFTKFLRDQGHVNFNEPFMKMRHQGMILGPDNRKMSKSKGNVISPDDVIEKFGADTLRVYEMFMGPIEADKPWDPRAVVGVYKFLQRVFTRVEQDLKADRPASQPEVARKLHQTIAKVSADIPALKFNTAIASMMECLNTWDAHAPDGGLTRLEVGYFVRLLAPFAPFLADELWEQCSDHGSSVHLTQWPAVDAEIAREQTIQIAVQVNGKLRGELTIAHEQAMDEAVVVMQARDLPGVSNRLSGGTIQRTIFVPGKIVNFVIS